MFKFLLPKNGSFFDHFEKHIALAIEACKELIALASGDGELSSRILHIKDIEHKADAITRRCIESLHKTFITPIDRADIHRLIKRLDDVIDGVDAATSRIAIYEIKEIRSEVKDFADILLLATTEIEKALQNLRNMKNAQKINENCHVIYEAEHEGDVILRRALGRLFKEENQPIMIIKWKEIFEILERAADRCEDVANIIEGVVIEAS